MEPKIDKSNSSSRTSSRLKKPLQPCTNTVKSDLKSANSKAATIKAKGEDLKVSTEQNLKGVTTDKIATSEKTKTKKERTKMKARNNIELQSSKPKSPKKDTSKKSANDSGYVGEKESDHVPSKSAGPKLLTSTGNNEKSMTGDGDKKSISKPDDTNTTKLDDTIDLLTASETRDGYWEEVAEARRQALEEVIEENEQLRDELEISKAEVEHFQKLVKKALKLAQDLDIDLLNYPSDDENDSDSE